MSVGTEMLTLDSSSRGISDQEETVAKATEESERYVYMGLCAV